MTQANFIKLKSLLPPNYAFNIAVTCKCSQGYVRKALKGKTKRMDIIDTAIDLATKHQNEINERAKKIDNI